MDFMWTSLLNNHFMNFIWSGLITITGRLFGFRLKRKLPSKTNDILNKFLTFNLDMRRSGNLNSHIRMQGGR